MHAWCVFMFAAVGARMHTWCVYMCVAVCTYVPVCGSVYICAGVWQCVHMCRCVAVCTCVPVCGSVYICICAGVWQCVHMCRCVAVCTYVAVCDLCVQTAQIQIINSFNPFSGFMMPTYILKSKQVPELAHIIDVMGAEVRQEGEGRGGRMIGAGVVAG